MAKFTALRAALNAHAEEGSTETLEQVRQELQKAEVEYTGLDRQVAEAENRVLCLEDDVADLQAALDERDDQGLAALDILHRSAHGDRWPWLACWHPACLAAKDALSPEWRHRSATG